MLKQDNVFQVAWIPQYGKNKAKVEVGKMVQLEDVDGWWEIMSVSRPKDGIEIKERERDYQKMPTYGRK